MTILDRLGSPDRESRIMMRWWWFGPAVTEEEIDHQLTVMQQAGIGGVELSVVYPLCVDGRSDGLRNIPYLTDEFLACVRHTAERTRELGMRLDITLGSGWPFGGPHIPVEKSVRRLRVHRVLVNAGAMEIKRPALSANEKLLAAVVVDVRDGETILASDAVHSMDAVRDSAGRLCSAVERDVEVRFLSSAPTGLQVKTAAVGAEGYVLDHYDREALLLHLDAVGRKLLEAAGRENVRAVFCDSLEVAGGNWTASLPAEFKRRRGYDLQPHLGALFVGDDDVQQRIRHDYGQTLTELLNENFLKPLQAFAHANGVLSRVQAYGQPPATLSSYKYVDIPEGEAARASDAHETCSRAGWTEITPNRIASSAARQQDKKIVSAETWTWLHSPPFAATPLDMKSEADQYFLQGINRLIGHGWPYSPSQVERPGWMFYAAANFNDHNPWFPVMVDIAAYLQTVSHALSLGRRTGGVAVYLPVHDVWAGYRVTDPMPDLLMCKALKNRIGEALPRALLRLGYSFDLIDDEGLAALAAGTGPGYAAVILPGVERIPPESADALCRVGERMPVVAVGRRPDRSAGYLNRKSESAIVARLMQVLFDGDAGGTLIPTPGALRNLRRLIPSAVSFERPHPDLGYVHRALDDGDLFFFANTSNEGVAADVTFRSGGEGDGEGPRSRPERVSREELGPPASARGGKYLVALDPVTGGQTVLSDDAASGPTTVRLSLRPFASLFVIANQDGAPAARAYRREREVDLSRDWFVRFAGTGIAKTMSTLHSWTASSDTRYYSGEAVYTKEVELDGKLAGNGHRVRLMLGAGRPVRPRRTDPERPNRGHIAFIDTPVKDAARVFVNGQRAGALWTPPYEVDVTRFVKPGRNRIEIRVYNRLINHMAALTLEKEDHPCGDGLRGVDGVSALEPEDAGLMGPVRLLVEELL